MSSRKMSESGWRPTVVVSRSSEEAAPGVRAPPDDDHAHAGRELGEDAPSSSSSSWRSSTASDRPWSRPRCSPAARRTTSRSWRRPRSRARTAGRSRLARVLPRLRPARSLAPPPEVEALGAIELGLLLLDEPPVRGRVEQRVDLATGPTSRSRRSSPSPYGSLLSCSGASSSDAFTSTIVPLTGA